MNLTQLINNITGIVAQKGLDVLVALVVLIIGRVVAKWIRRIVTRGLEHANADETLVPFLAGLAYWSVTGVVVVIVLGMVGIQAASLVAVLGAAGLAVGLALQGTLSNFAAGVMLLVFRPFRVGDFVEAGGEAGAVKAIGLFSISLATGDNVEIVIPNQTVWGSTIKNYAANETRRNDMIVGISYHDDMDVAINTIKTILADEPRVLADPEPLVAVMELGDSAVNLVVRPWCKKEDYWGLRFDLMKVFKEKIEAAGCSFPYPQRDVHLYNASGTG